MLRSLSSRTMKKVRNLLKGSDSTRVKSEEDSNTHWRQRYNSLPTVFVQGDDDAASVTSCESHSRDYRRNSDIGCSPGLLAGNSEDAEFGSLLSIPERSSYCLKSDRDKVRILLYKHENIYRGLIRSLIHPLGAPDETVGLRPGDLLDHVREVFEVEREDHEYYILEEMPNMPKSIQVNVTIFEANGLKGQNFSDDTCDTFCQVSLHHPVRGRNSGGTSPRLSPKVSPRVSPTMSPSSSPMMSRKVVHQELDTQRTSTVKHSSHPKWNEEFTMDIEDYLTDEVHIFVCNKEISSDVKQDKSTVRNLLGLLKHSDSDFSGCIGKVIIPVRDISAMGSDDWYDIVSVGSFKTKPKPVGKCHLRLGISYTQAMDNLQNFSTEDYYQAYRQFLQFTYSQSNPSARSVDDQYGLLSLQDYRILKMFAEAHGISKLSQAIVTVTCLLEIQCERDEWDLGESTLCSALDDLHMTWAAMQIGQKNLLDRMPLTDTEISNYRRSATNYINQSCDKMDTLPELFPPSVKNLNILKSKLGVTVQLLNLDLWEASCDPQKAISKYVSEKLSVDMEQWINLELKTIRETSPEIKDTVIPEYKRLIELVDLVCSHCTPLPVLKHFYTALGINYYRVISFALEKKISAEVTSIMDAMHKYKKRYNNFSVNILTASKLTLRMYFKLRKLYNMIRDNVTRREVFRLTLSHYQEWFEESMVYWLQTFRTECILRMEKALEIDKDVVVVTSLLKYSHSSVDVLSCFAQMIGEWRKIDFRDADCALMGVTNITDIICDGARLYADKIHSILERNGYYDNNLNAEFDVNDRLCITLNNIEHVRLYLAELPELLAWDSVVLNISTQHDCDDVGNQAAATLRRLIDTSNEEILLKSSQLLKQIAEKMRADMDKFMDIFTKKEPQKASSVDQFLGYISTNLQTLNEQLMKDIYPYMIKQLWDIILQSFDHQLQNGQHPDYYEQMKQHLRALGSYFVRAGLDEKKLHTVWYDDFKSRLDMNSCRSEDLMLLYYFQLATDMVTPTECYGHLAFKAAYMEETRGNVTIFVTILRGSDLPGLDSSGFSDPYVEVSLQPQALFGANRVQKTHIVKQTLNPVFNVTFQFSNIPREYLEQKGGCILLSVFDYDHIGRDDFAGEVVVHIPSISCITFDMSIDKMPAIIMPLKRPKRLDSGAFAILSQRDWDKSAKRFISDRSHYIDRQRERTDTQKQSSSGFFSSLLSSMF